MLIISDDVHGLYTNMILKVNLRPGLSSQLAPNLKNNSIKVVFLSRDTFKIMRLCCKHICPVSNVMTLV